MVDLEYVTLKTSTPCPCKRPVRLRALVDVPVETYTRRCSGCGAVWNVKRTLVRLISIARVDTLAWECIRDGRGPGKES
jgi:hypothetical protein